MNSFEKHINETYVKNNLNPDVWVNGKLRPKIRAQLLKIAEDFLASSKLSKKVIADDIIFTGSLANYNWTHGSDIDLHMVVALKQRGSEGEADLEYLHDQASIWNEHHKVMIYGHPVEIYVQEKSEPHYSTGIFSLKKEKWIREPKKHPEPNLAKAKKKAKELGREIEQLLYVAKKEVPAIAVKKLDKYRDKIRNLRRSSLAADGEYATNNLAFKMIRNGGYIERLIMASREAYDKSVSIKESIDSIIEELSSE